MLRNELKSEQIGVLILISNCYTKSLPVHAITRLLLFLHTSYKCNHFPTMIYQNLASRSRKNKKKIIRLQG